MAQEMCSIHPDKEVVDTCVHCGKRVCVACAATLGGKTYCFECIKLVDATSSGARKEVAWENRSKIGFMKALAATWVNIVMHPKKFFEGMPVKAGIKDPLLFALICGCFAVIVAAFINIVVVASGGQAPNMPPGAAVPPGPALIGSYVVLAAVSPLLVVLGLFILSAIYQSAVFIFGGREGFGATFRVLSYTNALAVFNIIPVLGPIFVTFYSIILFVIGFKQAQRLSSVRSVLAAVLPMLILFVIGFAAAFYLAGQGALPAMIPQAAIPAMPPALGVK